jgi:hypothetical protein
VRPAGQIKRRGRLLARPKMTHSGHYSKLEIKPYFLRTRPSVSRIFARFPGKPA